MAFTPNTKRRNFTNFEKHHIIDLVLQYKSIIENKFTDGATLEKKAKAWEEITRKFNCSNQSGERTSKQLKELYYVLKKNARKNLHDDKRESFKTGGGLFVPKSTEVDEKLTAVLREQFEPDTNPYDSSAQIFDHVPSTVPTAGSSSKKVVAEVSAEVHSPPAPSMDSASVARTRNFSETVNNPINLDSIMSHSDTDAPLENTPEPETKRRRKDQTPSVSKKITSFDNFMSTVRTRKIKKNEISDSRHQQKTSLLELEMMMKRKEMDHKQELFQLEKEIKIKQLQGCTIENDIKEMQLKILKIEYENKLKSRDGSTLN